MTVVIKNEEYLIVVTATIVGQANTLSKLLWLIIS
jgi:hypothetical protein